MGAGLAGLGGGDVRRGGGVKVVAEEAGETGDVGAEGVVGAPDGEAEVPAGAAEVPAGDVLAADAAMSRYWVSLVPQEGHTSGLLQSLPQEGHFFMLFSSFVFLRH